jgi:hypothetical protein
MASSDHFRDKTAEDERQSSPNPDLKASVDRWLMI